MTLYKRQWREWRCTLVHQSGAQSERSDIISGMLRYGYLHPWAQGKYHPCGPFSPHPDHLRGGLGVRDAHGWTSLHYVAVAKFLQALDFLLDQGADTSAQDFWTPLHYACQNGCRKPRFGGHISYLERTVDTLIRGGADVNA